MTSCPGAAPSFFALQARLGPQHMQYVHLVDQLLYLEEVGGLRP